MATKDKKMVRASKPQRDIDDRKEHQLPPLKPFIKSESRNPGKLRDQLVQSGASQRFAGIPGIPRYGEGDPVGFDDKANCLTVGANISFSGEITSCEKLIVEGNVEVKLTNAETLEVLAGGNFKGSATVATAQINGCFDGKLEVKGVLRVLKEGRLSGSVRYGKIIIESGGEIFGDMKSFASAKSSDKN